ncbi:TIGR02452 family protein [Actinoplanes sp. LDG1-06]|uniref:TIGR02452 family protein n=1 Tax=Paractinoplanes ovalisporus TaxID=2810368 RepID=A0ABS2AJQ8_9ACTN|nr:TIGR02452 family protein [Actinoplanes ovalisporus]MBM2620084.1 TIGR02452 family protein [Actinoplanes ovalisporus]
MKRDSRLRAIAEETVGIVERGGYPGADIGRQVEKAVAGTRLHLPDEQLPEPDLPPVVAHIEVTGETTLAAARRLAGEVACLNFASARKPGGGFLNGAEAQEEFLARSSALYPCLRAVDDFYAYHQAQGDPVYSDRVIYSPAVPVFRDDRGELLDEPYEVSFLTCAAPNTAVLEQSRRAGVPVVLERRAARILEVAAAHGHRRLVLGAWGCGVFGNDPATVAEIFGRTLRDRPWFDEVVFAVLDHHPAAPTRSAFAAALSREP